MDFKHTSVLLREVIDGLAIRPDGLYIDGTLGGGGHSFEIASRLTAGGRLIGIDQDEEALAAAAERLAPFEERVALVHDNYENMARIVWDFEVSRKSSAEEADGPHGDGLSEDDSSDDASAADGSVADDPSGPEGGGSPEPESGKEERRGSGILQKREKPLPQFGPAAGILLDLGVSSYQLDNPLRGFSYRTDAPLDMRMDRGSGLSAREIVNSWTVQELTRILRDYGEERCAAKIASNIERARQQAPIETTGQLAQIVERSIPMRMRERGGNPCKRTFQAIRIACNRELEVLEDSLEDMISLLAPGGRLCIITFHSLEDRIVKNAFKRAENPCTCPPEFPVCVCGRVPKGRTLTRKPILPGKEELAVNRRSASAKLRIFEKRQA